MGLSRREVMKIGGLGALGAAGVGTIPFHGSVGARTASELAPRFMPLPFTTPFARPPVLTPTRSDRDADGIWTDSYSINMIQARANVLRGGLQTNVWGYNGLVGGPTISVEQGRRTIVRVRNKLPVRHPVMGHPFTTSVHLHGSASKPQYDGYASDITPPGFYKDYHYPNFQDARTLWYHDHGVHHTAENAYSGLFAQYHLHDPLERSLLPQGEFDVPLIVTDAMFAADGQIAYDDNSRSGLWGDVIMVNGRPWPVMKVQRRVYRFRVLVASISRSYRFQLSTRGPMTLVATDGGLMPRSQTVTQWRHGAAERYEMLIDFSAYKPGQRVVLQNLSNDNNRDYDHTGKVMAFDVVDAPVDKSDPTWNRIPGQLHDSPVMHLTPAMAKRTRKLRLERSNGSWTINGNTWADVIDSRFELLVADPEPNDVEVWEIENRSGGWFHPLHIHLVDFRVLSRNGRPPFPWELGPKDVVYMGENETVRVVMRFEHQVGRYMVHCHNLPHEDHDMMQQFAVGWKPGMADVNDPIKADPCKADDLPEDA